MSQKQSFSARAADCVQPKSALSVLKDSVLGMIWSPDKQKLAISAGSGIVRLWNIEDKKVRFEEKVSEYPVTAVDWSADGDLLACTNENGSVIVCDSANLQKARKPKRISYNPLRCAAWAPRGSLLAVGGGDCKLYLVDCRSSDIKVFKVGSGHDSPILSLAWSLTRRYWFLEP
jgi:WD40 repeat protein